MRNIGIPIKNLPKEDCKDENCPYHGHLKVRGRTFTGEVVSDKMIKGVVVKWGYAKMIPKYQRYERKTSKVVAYNPSCINSKNGDKVKIVECRPISKTKRFVVVEKVE